MPVAAPGRLSLSLKAKLALGFVILLVLSTLVGACAHFVFFSKRLVATRNETIPTLVYSTTLARQSTWMRGQMDQGLAISNPLIRQHIVSTLGEYKGYEVTLQGLRDVHAAPHLLVTLEKEFTVLQQLAVEAIGIRTRQDVQQEHMRYIHSRLRTLLQKLSNVPVYSQAEQRLSALCTRLISRMLSLYQEEKAWAVSIIFAQCAKDILEQKTLVDALGSPEGSLGITESVFHEVYRLLTASTGLMVSKRQELALAAQFAQKYSRASFMGETIVQSCGRLLEDAEGVLQRAQESTIARFDILQHSIYLFLLILVLFFIGAYVFLQRNVLAPILRLTKAIQRGIATVQQGGHAQNRCPWMESRKSRQFPTPQRIFCKKLQPSALPLNSHIHCLKSKCANVPDASQRFLKNLCMHRRQSVNVLQPNCTTTSGRP